MLKMGFHLQKLIIDHDELPPAAEIMVFHMGKLINDLDKLPLAEADN